MSDDDTADPMRALVKSQFGANAANYATSRVHAKGASLGRLVELVKPHKTWRALDIATGAGHTAAAFAPHVAEVMATDITDEMLVETRKLAAAHGFANMTTAVADAEDLPFPDASFDLVTCRIAPHHFPSIPAFLAQVARVLKPGAIFALVDNVAPDARLLKGFSKNELRHADIAYNAFEKARDPSHGRALTTTEWLELFAETGFALRHTEHQPKAMLFNGWCKTMAVPVAVVSRLESMLVDAEPVLKTFMKPQRVVTDGAPDVAFELTELIAIGQNSA